MDNNEKINFDLNFLDDNAKEKPKEKPNTSKDPNWVFHESNKQQTTPKKKGSPAAVWLWGAGIVGVLVLLGALSGNGSSSSDTTSAATPATTDSAPNTSQNVTVDGYMCSQSDSEEADNLDPDLNNTEINEIDSEQAALDQRSTALNEEDAKVTSDDASLDDTDQSAVDTYNAEVDEYNANLQQYKTDLSTLNAKIDAYNTSEMPRNNYLAANCTKDD